MSTGKLIWEIIAEILGMKYVSCENYHQTLEDLDKYLLAISAKNTNAKELTRPGHPEIAKDLGYDYLLPAPKKWYYLIGLCGVFNKIREGINKPILINNWYRPPLYNNAVQGAYMSDHTVAAALDVTLRNDEDRKRAIEILKDLDEKHPMLKLSLGITYRAHVHFGVNSPGGRRRW